MTGYGERPILPVLWAVLFVVALFPTLYWITGSLSDSADGFPDAIAYSATTFSTLSFNRLQPDSSAASVISAVEAVTGVIMFALVVFTVGNRMSRS